jgi:hypothetical protein
MASARHRFPLSSFLTPPEFIAMSPAAAFHRLIMQKEKYGPRWLIEQLEILHQEPEVQYTLSILDALGTLKNIENHFKVVYPNKDMRTHLLHINAESNAARLRIEADGYRKMAEKNLSLYQKLKRNIRKTLDK